jgi:hypothetical protein
LRTSRNTSFQNHEFFESESNFGVNKILEYAHYFFVRNDSNSRGRERTMAKTAAKKKAPAKAPAKAKAKAKKTVARRKPAARKAARRK